MITRKIRQINYSVLFIMFLICSSFYGYDQNVYHTGLLFNASPTPKEQRTSLNITPNQSLDFRKKMVLNFDISFWNPNQYGYVFRISNREGHTIDLVYIPKRDNSSCFDLVLNQSKTGIRIGLPREQLIRNRWFNFDLAIDFTNGEFIIQFNQQTYKTINKSFINKQKLNIFFGANQKAKTPITDVPRMAIRNIKICDQNGKMRYNWLLNEAAGNYARNLGGGQSAIVEHPHWLINNHFYWTRQNSFTTGINPGIAMDKHSSNIVFLDQQKLYEYDIIHHNIKETTLKNRDPFYGGANRSVYVPEEDKIYIFKGFPDQYAILDLKTKTWETKNIRNKQNSYTHPTVFYDSFKKRITSIGGYSDFSYKNQISCLEPTQNQWQKRSFYGDQLLPRYFGAVGESRHTGQYYIFGGYGNSSGKQELGSQCLYDLYILNSTNSSINRKWTLPSPEENFIPASDLVVETDESNIYTLGYPPFLNSTLLRLYRLSVKQPSSTLVSDTIHYNFDEEKSKARLFFCEKTHEFIAIVSQSINNNRSRVSIYTLLYPPVNKQEIESAYNTIDSLNKFPAQVYWLVLAFIPFAILLFIYLFIVIIKSDSKNKEKLQDGNLLHIIKDSNSSSKLIVSNPPVKNAIYLWGEFKAFDRNGNNISSRFTLKLKQIFTVTLLYNAINKEGIQSQSLNNILWPYHTPQSAKNNRSVNVKKLREVLSEFDGIELLFENNHWKLNFTETFCDVNYVLQIIKKDENTISRNKVLEILYLLNKGIFLDNMDSSAFESLTTALMSIIQDFLSSLAISVKQQNDPELLLLIAQAGLMQDPINEEGIRLKIDALIRLKKHTQARTEYDNFCQDYKVLYGVAYTKSFHDFSQHTV